MCGELAYMSDDALCSRVFGMMSNDEGLSCLIDVVSLCNNGSFFLVLALVLALVEVFLSFVLCFVSTCDIIHANEQNVCGHELHSTFLRRMFLQDAHCIVIVIVV
jgi:hypothetical protein